MKMVLFAVIGLLSFAGALAGGLAMTGNLSGEALSRIVLGPKAGETGQREGTESDKPRETEDPLGPLAQQIKKKENELKDREDQLNQREAQINQRETELAQLQTKLEELQKQIGGSLADADKERQTRIQTVASTIEKMKPLKAAESLQNMPPEDAAAVLSLVKAKERGKVVEAMKPEMATRVLRLLQEPPKP